MASLNSCQKNIKRIFDFFLSLLLILILAIPILVLVLIATIDTKKSGVFGQERIGQYGKHFKILKIRIYNEYGVLTGYGKFLNDNKLNEILQLFNVLIGDMSFVGPRPDLPGFADKLKGDDRIVLSIKPGITGPATITFINEDKLLKNEIDHQKYNNEVIWAEKIRLNKEYIVNYNFFNDIKYLFKTINAVCKFKKE